MSPYLDKHPRRRSTDTRARVIRDIFRDVGTLFAVILAATAVLVQSDRVSNNEQLAQRDQEGRAVALDVTCAALSSLIEGGRIAIRRGAARPGDRIVGDPAGDFEVKSGKLSLFLEQHGLPGPEQRVRKARAAAGAYALDTAAGIAAASGRSDLVRSDGSLNCAKLKVAAKVQR